MLGALWFKFQILVMIFGANSVIKILIKIKREIHQHSNFGHFLEELTIKEYKEEKGV